jgi:hypothetical protein
VFDVSWSAFPPLILFVIVIGFTVYCLVDLVRASTVNYLPKWAWALICVVSEPLGGIVYLLVGRRRNE